MKLTIFTNYVHHHQLPLADEFYKVLGDNYKYVALEKLPDWLIKGGYDPTLERPYIIRAYESSVKLDEAKKLMLESDVVIGTSGPFPEVYQRQFDNKITFHYAERIFKKGKWHRFSPRMGYFLYKKYFRFRNKKTYVLAASAFAKEDFKLIGCFKDKCFKWGYFPKVDNIANVERTYSKVNETIKIMWCARFLSWKHPELPVELAVRLRNLGVKFSIDMFGSGPMYNKIQQMIEKKKLDSFVKLNGNLPNDQIIQQMKEHDVFLFTSDKGEGWGAVLNEAMSCGCAVITSDKIGAAPFLITDMENGVLFKSESINSLTEKVLYLVNNPDKIAEFGKKAYQTINNDWSPQVAAKRFLYLSNSLMEDNICEIKMGPCSKA